MSSPTNTASRMYFSPKEVEAVFGIPLSTLAYWRRVQEGSPYHRIGARSIKYGRADLDRWFEASRATR